jgi:phosphatidylserine synthase
VVDRLLRPVKARALGPASVALAGALGRLGAGPLTALALAVGLASAVAAALGAFGLALALWLLNRLVDGIDGEVARALDGASDRGGYLDLLGDLVVYAALPLGAAAGASGLAGAAALVTSPWTWPLAALVLASYYVNLGSYTILAALLEKRGRGADAHGDPTSVVMPAGLVEGVETIVLVALMLAFPAHLPMWFAITAALVLLTAGQRALWASRTLADAA